MFEFYSGISFKFGCGLVEHKSEIFMLYRICCCAFPGLWGKATSVKLLFYQVEFTVSHHMLTLKVSTSKSLCYTTLMAVV